MKKRILVFFSLIFIPLFLLNKFSKKPISPSDDFLKTFEAIQTYFFDRDLDQEKAWENACNGMIQALDKYGSCINKEEYKIREESFSGEFVGIGITIGQTKEKQIEIENVFANGPSFGFLKTRDLILEINNESLENKSLLDVSKLVRGPEGSEVNLKIYRPKIKKEIVVKIIRKKIIAPVVEFKIINKDINYIGIYKFNEKTLDHLIGVLDKSKNAKLIIDLRNNPGGLIVSVIDATSLFLDKDNVIFILKHKNGKEEKFFSQNKEPFKNKLVILINKNSASGSEIFAAAIKDNKRGLLIGERTFGKSSAQRDILTQRWIIRLTIYRLLSPLGNVIEGKGVKPDIKVKKSELQLQKAIEVLSKK